MNAVSVSILLLLFIIYLLYVISKRKFNYWEKKRVPYVKPIPFLGNYGNYMIQNEYVGQLVQKLCKKFQNKPYFGAFFGTEPVLIVLDPEIINIILTKEFYYFHGREISQYELKEVTTQNMFFSSGNRWKTVRYNLTSLFTTAKMRNMFHLIEKCSREFEKLLDQDSKISNVFEVRSIMARFTMDCICSCTFGIDSNTMKAVENNPFKFMADQLIKSSTYSGFKMIFRAVWPAIFYGLGFKYFAPEVNVIFKNMLTNVFKSRNYEPSLRNDFVDQLLSLKKQGDIVSECISNARTGDNKSVSLKVDDDLIVAQCTVFFGAGFETSATMLSFTLYELAKHPSIQERAAKEVDEYLERHKNKLDYECVNELPFLESCLYETIRLYPVLGVLTREVMDDVTLPTGLKLDKGIRIHIPVFHFHHNPEYFPDPESYKPERFLSENRDRVKPNTFFPYGGGQRTCIGKTFSKMQVLAGLVTFLKAYKVELADGMPESVEFESRSFLIQPKSKELNLKIQKRDGWENRRFVDI